MKKPNRKTLLIGGGIVLAAGALYLMKRKQATKEEESKQEPLYAPATYYSPGQEFSGNLGNFGGGGAPSSGAPGVTTTPPGSEEIREKSRQEIQVKYEAEHPSTKLLSPEQKQQLEEWMKQYPIPTVEKPRTRPTPPLPFPYPIPRQR